MRVEGITDAYLSWHLPRSDSRYAGLAGSYAYSGHVGIAAWL